MDIENEKIQQLERLLKENIELNNKILESCLKTEKYMFSIKAFGIIKFVVIIIPIVIGLLFLVPYVGDFVQMYKDFFSGTGAVDSIKNMKDLGL
ncbi:MAG: hypothetical protein PHZ07_01720 [Patescibacteria group bacterium]|nr:hypothetical protein [Patescibacteria group bacterium]MDD4304096.1 hypothetical protein [Patescibacteria group bacterium]MDD4694973.1 hypothetical protein [Patescibacteria group bacterium]